MCIWLFNGWNLEKAGPVSTVQISQAPFPQFPPACMYDATSIVKALINKTALLQGCTVVYPSELLLSRGPLGLIKVWISWLSMALISTSALWEAARAFFNHCSSPVASAPFCDLEHAICNGFETIWDKHLSPCCFKLLLIVMANPGKWGCAAGQYGNATWFWLVRLFSWRAEGGF